MTQRSSRPVARRTSRLERQQRNRQRLVMVTIFIIVAAMILATV